MPDYTLPEGAYSFHERLLASFKSGKFHRVQRHRAKRSKKPPPAFVDLPQKARRARAVSLGWRIRSDGQGRGVFFDANALPGWRWPENVEHHDGVVLSTNVWFLGQGHRPDMVYRAQVVSVAELFTQSVLDQAKAAVDAQVSTEDQAKKKRKRYHVPHERGSERMITLPAHRLPSLDGKTYEGAQAAWVRSHWDHLATVAKASTGVWVNPVGGPEESDNTRAIPLRIQTQEPNLSVDAMVRIIADFRAHGEAEQSEAPANFEPHRPIIEALLRAKLWQWDRVEAQARDEHPPAAPEDPAVMASFGYGGGHPRVIPMAWLVSLKKSQRRRKRARKT